MPGTLGYHIVISGYGLWLPGDQRGHWSTAWDEQFGFIEPHTLHEGDPVRLRMAAERMRYAPVHLSQAMMNVLVGVLADCATNSSWRIAAASIEPTHTHLQMTYSDRDVDITVKWIKDRATKAMHRQADHVGPVWCEGSWRSYIFDEGVWQATTSYIERHNQRRGIGPRPYRFLS